ncbi:GNAT family N-acetyltransferase [Kineococcus sp. SYSU DK001]|uniref:GNAT family N-acetyltransferase n=1 Tax=Kineococcus sp. SYSU DK001 TaxID=3383122 RepID=UPI003D7EE404
MPLSVRAWETADTEPTREVFRRSVHRTAADHYSPEQRDAWAPAEADLAEWGRARARAGTRVAVRDGEVAGFTDLSADGHIGMFYVHPDHGRRGVGAALLDDVLRTAAERGLTRLTVDASLTARPFFQRAGFTVVREQRVHRGGQEFTNVAMRLDLPAAGAGERRDRPRQVVWDMDGTLLDSTRVVPAAFVGAVAELGGPAVDVEEVVAAYSLGVPEVMLAHLVRRPLRPGEAEAYYRRLEGVAVDPYPGVAETLAALRAAGHPVAVFTGAAVRGARTLLRAAGLTVDVLIGGDLVARPKPAPDGLLLAARMLGVAPSDLLYVGDAPTDLGAARAAGAHAVAAAWGHLHDPAVPADATWRSPREALRVLDDPRG